MPVVSKSAVWINIQIGKTLRLASKNTMNIVTAKTISKIIAEIRIVMACESDISGKLKRPVNVAPD